MESANSAKSAFVSGKAPPAGKAKPADAPAPKKASAPARTEAQEIEASMRKQTPEHLRAIAASGKDYAPYAKAELDRRASTPAAPAAAPAPEEAAYVGYRAPKRSLPAW